MDYEFYMGRINSCPLYGFKAGSEILDMVIYCATYDDSLTIEQFNSIMNRANLCHKKLMEENYNADWNK